MNEITRIHIAKVPFDIEVDAKQELQKYINSLKLYIEDEQLLEDIELRMTELLAERGVKRDGLVTYDDVLAIQEQIGAPKSLLDDEDTDLGDQLVQANTPRLYRDPEGALVAGVLSGIAQRFHINVSVVRILFVLLTILSFGTSLAVYIAMWATLPPARTVTEKLQLKGKPVTIATIKKLHAAEGESLAHRKTAIARYMLRHLAAFFSTVTAAGVVALTIAGIWRILIVGDVFAETWAEWSVSVALGISGLLFTALLITISLALFQRKFSKRTGKVCVVLSVLSALAIGLAITIAAIFVSRSQ